VDTFLAICQGLGLALAVGAGGLLVALLVATLAHVDGGWSLDGTGWEFVGSEWFIALLFALNVLAFLTPGRRLARAPLLATLAALGAILFAASLAERGEAAWPGLIAGALAALLAALVVRDLLEGASRRSAAGPGGDGGLLLFGVTAGLVLAVASLLIPPISIPALVLILALAVARRRRGGRKYQGLRVLR
jgi:hypothetical protein